MKHVLILYELFYFFLFEMGFEQRMRIELGHTRDGRRQADI